ncbi:hypothetical protein ACR79S_17340 [Sphingobacterium spiritivorum]|uniref:hypothetical protein n=1 Tax=Sphingobacterium spiritivorum TaxID=258 RepID=UPI003DA2B01F
MERIKRIDWKTLLDSLKEVSYLTILAVLPILINFLIQLIIKANMSDAFKSVIVPSELLTYSLSFLAPTLYLILAKNHGTGYSLPFIRIISLLGIIIYLTCFCLYLIKKNGWLSLEKPNTAYFQLSISFLIITWLFRIYSTYHSKNLNTYFANRQNQQDSFNNEFARKIQGR